VVVVPDDAVQRGPNGLYVFVVGDDNKVSVQPVTVTQSDQDQSVVKDGLTPGRKIVVAGQYRLQAGSVVQSTDATGLGTIAKDAGPPEAP